MALLTWMFYYVDKKKATKNKWRIKENKLLVFPWLLGAIGGILGIYVTRHKTKHWYFKANNILAFIVQCFLCLLIIFI